MAQEGKEDSESLESMILQEELKFTYARVPATRIIKIKEGQCRIAAERFVRPKVGAANRCTCKGSGASSDNCLGLYTNASCVQTYDSICGTTTLSSNPALPSQTVWYVDNQQVNGTIKVKRKIDDKGE